MAQQKILRRELMLGWAITFLVVALIAAVLGFAEIAQILFVVFIVLFVVTAIIHFVRGRRPPM